MTPITTGSPTRARRHVALAYPLAVPWMTAFVRGVMDYGQRHGGWTLTTSPPSLIGAGEENLTLDRLRGWPGHGVITAILSQADIRSAARLGLPVVNLAATLRETGIPSVLPDHYGMGRLPAEHLMERGLRRLAYYGVKGFWFSELRCGGFAECVEQAGATCDVLQVPRKSGPWANWQKRTSLLVHWLKLLRAAVGTTAVSHSTDPNHLNPAACEHFAGHALAVARRAPSLEIGAPRTDDLRDFQGVPRPIDVEMRHVFAALWGDDPQPLIENLSARAVERLARPWRRHPAELLRADRHENVSLLQSSDEFFSFLRCAPVPTAGDAEQARADQDRLGAPGIAEKAALPLIGFMGHAIPLPLSGIAPGLS